MHLPRVMVMVVALALGACGEASLEQFEPAPEDPAPTDFTLRGGVTPILTKNNCKSCHNAGTFASQLDLDVSGDDLHANLIAGGARESSSYGQDINLALPSESLLLLAPLTDSNFPHSSQKFFSDVEDAGYVTVLGWIQNGAPND
jgi:hypothetical protein